jgi:DNA invertase Pin-like site-specific DNA recombinase
MIVMATNTILISYRRVSTTGQGISALGLDAQSSSIDAYAARTGGKVVKAYTEVESGKNNARPQLAAAIAHAKRIKGTLVIARLDRLARNVHFVSGLLESKVDFVACDMPAANKLTIHILAAVAEAEADRISANTVAALAQAKARGTKLGSARPGAWAGREHIRVAGLVKGRNIAIAKAKAATAATIAEVQPIAKRLRDGGKTLDEITVALNEQGYSTARGKAWIPMSVSRLLAA